MPVQMRACPYSDLSKTQLGEKLIRLASLEVDKSAKDLFQELLE